MLGKGIIICLIFAHLGAMAQPMDKDIQVDPPRGLEKRTTTPDPDDNVEFNYEGLEGGDYINYPRVGQKAVIHYTGRVRKASSQP